MTEARTVPAGAVAPSDRGQRTRAGILSAARRLFYLHGYEHTSVRAIFSAAGANVGLLKYYFTGKSQIGLIVYNEMREEFNELIGRYEPGLDGAGRYLFSSALELRLCLEDPHYAAFDHELDAEPDVRDDLQDVVMRVLQQYRAPGLGDDDYSVMASLSISAIKPALVGYAISHPSEIDKDAYLHYYLGEQLHYLGRPDEDADQILGTLASYHVAVAERFTPVMVPLVR